MSSNDGGGGGRCLEDRGTREGRRGEKKRHPHPLPSHVPQFSSKLLWKPRENTEEFSHEEPTGTSLPAFGGIHPGISNREFPSPQPSSLETTIYEVLQEGRHSDPHCPLISIPPPAPTPREQSRCRLTPSSFHASLLDITVTSCVASQPPALGVLGPLNAHRHRILYPRMTLTLTVGAGL